MVEYFFCLAFQGLVFLCLFVFYVSCSDIMFAFSYSSIDFCSFLFFLPFHLSFWHLPLVIVYFDALCGNQLSFYFALTFCLCISLELLHAYVFVVQLWKVFENYQHWFYYIKCCGFCFDSFFLYFCFCFHTNAFHFIFVANWNY